MCVNKIHEERLACCRQACYRELPTAVWDGNPTAGIRGSRRRREWTQDQGFFSSIRRSRHRNPAADLARAPPGLEAASSQVRRCLLSAGGNLDGLEGLFCKAGLGWQC